MCNSTNRSTVTRQSRGPSRALATPSIPTADPIDGLLTLEALLQPVQIVFPCWNEALPGDSCQITWGKETLTDQFFITDETPGTLISLEIPPELLKDGEYNVGYAATNEGGAVSVKSPQIPLIVDTVAPGGDLIAPMIFPFQTQDGILTADELTELGGTLVAEVPGYSGMAWGDQIRTLWGAIAGPEHTVTSSEVTMDRVMLSFPREFLESLGDVTEPVSFVVTDRAGNQSIKSNETTFRLFLVDIPDNYPAPVCSQANDGIVDDADARAGVAVDIPQYPDALPGDNVTLYWGTYPLPEVQLNPGDETFNPVFTINVRYGIVALAGDGPAQLHYEVRRNNVLIGTSLMLVVDVNITLPGPQDPEPGTPENEALAFPVIRGSSTNANNEDNVIDEDDFLLDAYALIGWRDDFAIGDVFTLTWGSQDEQVMYTLRSSDVNRDLLLTIPNRILTSEGTGEDIKVFYSVSQTSSPNISRSPAQSVSVHSQGDLPGGETGLQGPVFTNANHNNAISPILSPDGTPIYIAPYENIAKYPRVTVVFRGYNAANGDTPVPGASFEMTHVLDEFEIADGYSFRVTDHQLRLICTGRAEAYYRVEGPNGPVNSISTPVLIRMATPGSGC